MLRKFKIKIDGNEYLVEMEDLNPQAQNQPIQPAPTAQTEQAAQPEPAETPSAPVTAGSGEGNQLPAPMPGNIVDIKVAVGDKVQKNQPLLVLEAMKLENEIVSPQDGEVTGIQVAKGENVSAGDILLTIK